MQRIAYLLTFFIITALTSCGGKTADAVYGNLGLTIQVDQTRGEVGKPVHITFTITKFEQGNYDIGVIEGRDSEPVMDIIVGDELARWSEEQPPESITHRLDLKRGESKKIQMTWIPDSRADSNLVLIQGVLKGKPQIWQQAGVLLPIGSARY